MRNFKKLILAGCAALTLSANAHAAEWGAVTKGSCNNLNGSRTYSAKIWTGFGDKGPMAECKRTKADIEGILREPNVCKDYGAGIVYGNWYVKDSSCRSASTEPQTQIVPSPTQKKDDEEPARALLDPLRDTGFTIEQFVQKVKTAFADLDAAISDFSDDVSGLTAQKQVALQKAEDPEIRDITQSALAFATVLNGDSELAKTARKYILEGNEAQAAQTLAKMPSFVTLATKIEDSSTFKSFSIGLTVDAQALATLNSELGLAFGSVYGERNDTYTRLGSGALAYSAYAYGGGLTLGVDGGVNISIWTSPLDKLASDSHGVVLGASYNIGAALAFWWGYATDTDNNPRNDNMLFKGGFGDFSGFTVSPSIGFSGELEYNRAGMRATAPAVIFKD